MKIKFNNVYKVPSIVAMLQTCSVSIGASLVAQMVNNLPAMQETWVRSLGEEDPLEKEWLPTLVFLPGKSHGQSMGSQRVGHN